eukprot:CCRYP_001656-RA/>CCRYP_001656-RA protein AED:0.32 eAED:0.32 QI:0/-1/0/1/-1/1/1/0/62
MHMGRRTKPIDERAQSVSYLGKQEDSVQRRKKAEGAKKGTAYNAGRPEKQTNYTEVLNAREV